MAVNTVRFVCLLYYFHSMTRSASFWWMGSVECQYIIIQNKSLYLQSLTSPINAGIKSLRATLPDVIFSRNFSS
jgi:hypothetical protein